MSIRVMMLNIMDTAHTRSDPSSELRTEYSPTLSSSRHTVFGVHACHIITALEHQELLFHLSVLFFLMLPNCFALLEDSPKKKDTSNLHNMHYMLQIHYFSSLYVLRDITMSLTLHISH